MGPQWTTTERHGPYVKKLNLNAVCFRHVMTWLIVIRCGWNVNWPQRSHIWPITYQSNTIF